jgi:predicted glutamine amidotransferase
MDVIAKSIDELGGIKVASTYALATRIAEETTILTEYGEFNYALSDGQLLFIHSHSGLYQKKNEFGIVFTNRPAARETWQRIKPNTLLVVQDGKIVEVLQTRGRIIPEPGEAIGCEGGDDALYLTWKDLINKSADYDFDPNCG